METAAQADYILQDQKRRTILQEALRGMSLGRMVILGDPKSTDVDVVAAKADDSIT